MTPIRKKKKKHKCNVLEKRHSNRRFKPRNFLTNIIYSPINKNDHLNREFLVNVYTLLTQNLNPFSLDRKFDNQNNQQMIYMLWEKCIPSELYNLSAKKTILCS